MNNRSFPYSLRNPSYVLLYLFFLPVAALLFCGQPAHGETCQSDSHIDPKKSTPALHDCDQSNEVAEASILSFTHVHDFKENSENTEPPKLSGAAYYLDQYHENYNYYNNQVWFQYFKKTLPIAGSLYLHGMLKTVNLLSLNVLQMLSISYTISTLFNLGQDVSVEYTRLYGHSSGTSPDPDNWPTVEGRVAGGLTMLAIDLSLESYFNDNLPDINALTYPQTVSKFIKSVAVTGPLTKAMIGKATEKLINAGFAKDTSTAMAQGGSAAALGAMISLGAFTGLTSMEISKYIKDPTKSTAKLKTVTDAVADEFVNKMTTTEKNRRIALEQYPRAATVTTAYVTVDALISTCKVGLNRLELEETISKERQDELCMLMVSAVSLSSSWLALNSESWVKDGFSGVFVENIAEAGGVYMTGTAMKAAGSLSDEPITRDLLKMTAGTAVFTAFYSRNLNYPDKAFELNSRGGAFLSIVLEGSSIVMSHALPFAIVTGELVTDLAAESITSLLSVGHRLNLYMRRDNEQENPKRP